MTLGQGPLIRAVFLDRDGTVIEEKEYLREPEQVSLLPGASSAIRAINEAGWLAILISNQSGIGRGYFDEETLGRAQERLVDILSGQGGRIDDFLFCPHTPEENCDCRKPSPQLLLKASHRYGISLEESWMVGDKASDIETGRRAGCKSCLVLTGYGTKEASTGVQPDLVAPDLLTAIQYILGIKGDTTE